MYKNILKPDIVISHIGIVREIVNCETFVDYYYKAVIDLKETIFLERPMKEIEYWKLSDLGLKKSDMDKLRELLTNI